MPGTSAAATPSSVGTPWGRAVSQLLHNLLGTVEYVGGGIGLLVFSATYFKHRRDPVAQGILLLAGVVVLVVFTGIANPTLATWHGVIQWIGEAALFGSLLLIGWRLARKA